MVTEPAKEIPVVHDVDVVVVGGATGAIAAALAAAEMGARVFLAAPRPYLGEDLCATYRLWLEPGEEPSSELGRKLFDHPADRPGIPFGYETDLPSAAEHRDGDPPGMLTNGHWSSADKHSVQYDGNVTVTADMGGSRKLAEARVRLFQAPDDYQVDTIDIGVSSDGKSWHHAGEISNTVVDNTFYVDTALTLSAKLHGSGRYVRFRVRKAPDARRVLLGEIEIDGAEEDDGELQGGMVVTTPMQIKRTLDDALLEADIPFMYECIATDLLTDTAGDTAGIVVANRAGRQAIQAKVIIDATDRAWLARRAG